MNKTIPTMGNMSAAVISHLPVENKTTTINIPPIPRESPFVGLIIIFHSSHFSHLLPRRFQLATSTLLVFLPCKGRCAEQRKAPHQPLRECPKL